MRRWHGDDGRRLHPRPPRVGAAQPPLADGGELGGLSPPAPRRRRSTARRRLRAGHDHPRPRRPGRARAKSSASTSPTRSSPRRSRAAEEAGATNVTFARGDAYGVEAAAGSFDVVHAHQVLQHLGDPIAALTEMRRVLRPGGLLAVRDSDYGAFVWAPHDERLDHWMQLYHRVTERNGAQADAGRWLPAWVGAAGFTDLQVSSSTWTFADPASRSWWGQLWADRVRHSSFATQAKEYGLGDEGRARRHRRRLRVVGVRARRRVRHRPRRGARPHPGVSQSSPSASSSSSGSSSRAPAERSSRTSTSSPLPITPV